MNAGKASMVASRLADARTQAWVALRFARRPLSIDDILADIRGRAPMTRASLAALLTRWCSEGHVERVGQRPVRYAVTALAQRLQVDPPHDAGFARPPAHWTQSQPARQRLWTAARVMRSFDLVMLRMTADVSIESAKDFVRLLTRADYLRPVVDGAGVTRWSWIERPGPLAPVVRRIERDGLPHLHIIDRNTGQRLTVPVRPHRQQRPKGWAESATMKGGEVNHVC